MKTPGLFLFLSLSVILFVSSCRKENTDSDLSVTNDYALAEKHYDDVKDIVDQAYNGNLISYSNQQTDAILLSNCATISLDTLNFPRVLTIDFGTNNCLCNDGRYRRGKIIASFTGKYKQPGTVITITFNNYFVNDNQLLGTKTITNDSINNNGNLSFSIQVQGSLIKANNGGTITWNSNRTREWIAGSSTPNWLDDEYLITGTASGTSASGTPFSLHTLTPLHRKIGCRHFVSGKLEITITGKPTRILDYGNGNCDNDAVVTINGKTYNIKLR